MIVRTTWDFTQAATVIWPLLCNSRMEASPSCLFGLGLPQPKQCLLPDGPGGIGSRRQCVSDRGTVEQTILVWEEPTHLAFSMDRSDLYFRESVPSIVDDFELLPLVGRGTRVTRTTSVQVIGRFRWFKQVCLWIGLKKVHRFVFRNWARLASAAVGHPAEPVAADVATGKKC
jgi:hypothetical protein